MRRSNGYAEIKPAEPPDLEAALQHASNLHEQGRQIEALRRLRVVFGAATDERADRDELILRALALRLRALRSLAIDS
jgi:hypothetical protein